MPVIIRILGYKIYFFLDESRPLEPIHIHISEKPHKNATKVWILSNGKTEIENNNSRIPERFLNRICKTVETFNEEIKEKWQSTFGEIRYHDIEQSKEKNVSR